MCSKRRVLRPLPASKTGKRIPRTPLQCIIHCVPNILFPTCTPSAHRRHQGRKRHPHRGRPRHGRAAAGAATAARRKGAAQQAAAWGAGEKQIGSTKEKADPAGPSADKNEPAWQRKPGLRPPNPPSTAIATFGSVKPHLPCYQCATEPA